MPAVQEKTSSIDANAIQKKPLQKSIQTSKTPTLKYLIDSAFQTQLKLFNESKQPLAVGDAVLARMKGFLPWPARIDNFASNNKIINCYFYGTNNSGPVGSKNVLPYVLARETVRLACLRSQDKYIKGVKEIEVAFNVPDELSYLKECKALK